MRAWLALAGVTLLALLVRARSAVYVFANAGEVVLRSDDTQYHARRAAYSLEHYPDALSWDPYLAFPAGGHVPWPPLWDFLLASVAGVFGGTDASLDRVLAWSAAVVASLTVIPVYWAARSLAGSGTGLGAALLFAFLPASLMVSSVGSADHHAVVGLEGACLLACGAHALRARVPAHRRAALIGIVLARTALVLSWQGSILYLGVEALAFIGVAAMLGRTTALTGHAIGLLATAAAVSPFAAGIGAEGGPVWSILELSRLHVLLLCAGAATGLGVAGWERMRPASDGSRRLLRLGVTGLAVGILALLIGGVPPQLATAFAYTGKTEPWIAHNFENVPLFSGGSSAVARRLFDRLVFCVPLVPVAFALRARSLKTRGPAIFLGLWSAVFAVLALSNARYANDFAAVCVVGVALLLGEIARVVSAATPLRRLPRAAIAVGIGAALLAATLSRIVTGLPQLFEAAAGDGSMRYGPATFHRDAHRFAVAIRQATPAPSDPYDVDQRPSYGLLSFPTLGSLLVRVAERPVTATGFGPYVGRDAFEATDRFYALTSEAQGVALARRLGARYVVTSQEGRPRPTTLLYRLHMEDGGAVEGRPALAHFRLITEAPERGLALGFLSGTAPRQTQSPYKLFELVEGAVLEVRGKPGARLTARLGVETPTGRRFVYRTETFADAEGVARLRLPYATHTDAPTAPLGPYRLGYAGETRRLALSDQDVVSGRIVPWSEATRAR